LSTWIAGLEKIPISNRRPFEEAAHDEDRYPSLSDRKKFAETVVRRIRKSETRGQQSNRYLPAGATRVDKDYFAGVARMRPAEMYLSPPASRN
jgi:hypothetical protein